MIVPAQANLSPLAVVSPPHQIEDDALRPCGISVHALEPKCGAFTTHITLSIFKTSTAEPPWPLRFGAGDENVVQGDVVPTALDIQADRALSEISGFRSHLGYGGARPYIQKMQGEVIADA